MQTNAPRRLVEAVWVAHGESIPRGVQRQWLGNVFGRETPGRAACQWVASRAIRRAQGDAFRTLERQLRTLALGVWLSRHMDAGDLQQLLVEQQFFGRGATGATDAARVYFDEAPEGLTLAEVAFLAGLALNPHSHDPECSPARARKRRDWVLQRLVDEGVVTPAEAAAAMKEPVVTLPRTEPCR